MQAGQAGSGSIGRVACVYSFSNSTLHHRHPALSHCRVVECNSVARQSIQGGGGKGSACFHLGVCVVK